MNRRRAAVIAAVLAASVSGWLAWTTVAPLRYDPARVDPALQALVEPFRKVSVDCYVDGGSVGVAIVDQGGGSGKFLLPVSPAGAGAPYGEVLVGVSYPKEPGGRPATGPDDTRRRLTEIVARYGDGGPDADMAIIHLRGAPLDILRSWIHRRSGN